MTPLNGRLFGPGLPPAGLVTAATLDAVQLSVALPDGRRLTAPLSQLSLRAAGFDSRHWEFSWSTGVESPWALMVDDAATIAAIRRNPPAALKPAIDRLAGQERRQKLHRGLGLSAVALWVGLPLLGLLLLFLAARPLAGMLANVIPAETEMRLGEQVFAMQSMKLDLIRDTAANRAVETIGQTLTQGSRYRYRWHITRDASLNAFAVPGGIIVVHSGLILAADNADELAGVIAHEIEHVELRHSLKAMMQQAGLRLAVAAVIGDFGIAGEAAGRLSGLSFSRDSESEADLRGLRRLRAAGIDPAGMLELFGKLGAQGGVNPPAWLSSHPATPERIAQLREAIAAQAAPSAPKNPLAKIDWESVQFSLRE